MLNQLINIFRAAKIRHKNNMQTQRVQNVKNRFSLCEHDGELYILCEGYPISILPSHVSVSTAIGKLEELRKNALKFHDLIATNVQ